MNLETLLKNNLIKKVNPDFKQIHSQLIRAKKDLNTAISITNTDLTWSFAITYHSMLRAGRALFRKKIHRKNFSNNIE